MYVSLLQQTACFQLLTLNREFKPNDAPTASLNTSRVRRSHSETLTGGGRDRDEFINHKKMCFK